VGYNAVLLERRRLLHECAARAIEGLFAERLSEHYHALAHHYRRSGNTTKAIDYLHRAGQQAVDRSAYAEAVGHLTTALDLLIALPGSYERSQQELTVQMSLGMALRATKGANAPEVEQCYIRARALCEQVGEPPQLFRVLWGFWIMSNQRGDAQTMRALGEQLLSLAQQLAHPSTLTLALYWAAVLHHLRREAPLTQTCAEAAMTVATDQEFRGQVAAAMTLWGSGLAASGHGQEERAQIQQGLAAYRARRAARDRPYQLALLAEVSAQVGHTTKGLEAVAEALATVAESAVHWWEAELYRLKGQLLLQHAGAPPEEAEACFQQALAVARRQQAKALELRGAMSLARLWLQQGKRAEAHALLAPIYGWFTEGFDTADLQEAKALREALA
jgi:predicted ATPase